MYRKKTWNQWITWNGQLSKERVVERYQEEFGRLPHRIHSPKESATASWWTGWVGKDEIKPSAWIDEKEAL